MYQALYRRFRPETFEGILGQEHIVKVLKNQIKNDTVGHAYLFCGTRGTGKTTMARLLAKGVNCTALEGSRPCGSCPVCMSIKNGMCMDVIEIDAASNNGVDNIRELRESVSYPPVQCNRKVYIVDEVHMLTLPAFNALLKTLEEPPGSIMFILATTEPQKLPATILSRCLKLDFRRIPEKQLKESLSDICKKLNVEVSDSALALIAANADGSARDSLSLLDQCLFLGDMRISKEDVLELLGTGGEEFFIELTDQVENRDAKGLILHIDRILQDGKDVRRIIRDWISHYRNLMIAKFVNDPGDLLSMSYENIEKIKEQSQRIDTQTISEAILALSEVSADAKWSTQPRILLELCAIKLAGGYSASFENLNWGDKGGGGANGAGVWNKVLLNLDLGDGLYGMLKNGSCLAGMEDDFFFVEAKNDVARQCVEKNEALIESAMEKVTGRKLSMRIGK
jgi:DNA polymerase-3 subunit gamma/tau